MPGVRRIEIMKATKNWIGLISWLRIKRKLKVAWLLFVMTRREREQIRSLKNIKSRMNYFDSDLIEIAKLAIDVHNARSIAEEMCERAEGEGWSNDPTGSLHLSDAWNKVKNAEIKLSKLIVVWSGKREMSSLCQ